MKIVILSYLGKWILKLFYGLNIWDVRGKNNYLELLNSNQSVIISCWHGQLLAVFMNLSGNNYHGLAGMHKDAELISQIGQKLKWSILRGSSKERGKEAFIEIVDTLNSESTLLAITPDGPSGPARVPKHGVIRASQKTGAPVVPVTVHSSRNWTFTNWDTFFVEKPFGKIWIEYGEPIYFTEDEPIESGLNILTNAMNELENHNLYHANNSQ
ncbi:MAG: DUF374 domain-containing protein [Candidatus Marinimicrobia bacterium]|jgi:hypothetical protein|nr:DUF374 domain-containing protein [Candidatus Neomarinimicrobiota bacterium]MBT3937295.1 DUF374 domain-containing protein [Candidatus Neomarinimicrobiota bacterium]MBT3961269.1 DUF374 domain-containing protein [Candidatus Neomarinimicrobiota bacterium]MBT4383491.1 DUF374 domain-containing protein [Candidatus Neomarinimicrobiota bacterium]MBT4636433.1 DUF374 domain-containing protein [Candidatus Neomarinimicrobiota bacterium]